MEAIQFIQDRLAEPFGSDCVLQHVAKMTPLEYHRSPVTVHTLEEIC